MCIPNISLFTIPLEPDEQDEFCYLPTPVKFFLLNEIHPFTRFSIIQEFKTKIFRVGPSLQNATYLLV